MESIASYIPDEKDELDEVVEDLGGEVQKKPDGETIHRFPEDKIPEQPVDKEN